MADIKLFYALVGVDLVPAGMNLFVSMCPEDFYASEKVRYPYDFTYMGEFCTWILRSNIELTARLVVAVGEQCDRMCYETERRNATRKIANRS